MRPTKSQGRDLFYQTPTNCSDEEIQRISEFLKKLQETDDKKLNRRYVGVTQRYLSDSITYIQLKRELFYTLRRNRDLFKEYRQLLSYFASPARNHSEKENPISELKRSVAFLQKIEALGESVDYKAFIHALAFSGDNEILVEQLREMLRGHESLKEEFETFLIDNRLIKRKRDAEKGSWVLNEKINRFEGKYMEEDMLPDLDSFLEFEKVVKDDLRNKKRREKQREGLSGLLEWLCNGKKVPPESK
ncbi:unnamed protein product [Eruca vesicaria subsp. sativa]|uniref:Uncharacterized protein n=1 Tax=Eruca vesicaria subsp. sativa TaxID=29727 RepID=A0ABC8L018_ERUVS|nr:unnamed protein product [Eruca vesicaria subsp. sativa]